MEYRIRTIWRRTARTTLLKILSTLFMVFLSPLWVESGRIGLLAVLGTTDLVFLGIWDIRPLSVPEGAAVLSLGVFASIASVVYSLYLWYHGFLKELSVEPGGLRKVFDGNPKFQKFLPWDALVDVKLQVLSGGVAVCGVLARPGRRRNVEELLVVVTTNKEAEQMSRDILCAREAWNSGLSASRKD